MFRKYFLWLLPVLLLSNCRKEETFLFEIPYVLDFSIPAGLSTFDTHTFEFTNIPTRINNVLANQNLPASDVQRINARIGRFSTLFPGQSYNFIREVVVEIFDNQNPTTTGREIFFRDRILPSTGDELFIDASLPDVKEFLLQDFYNIRIELRLQNISPTLVETRFELSFVVR